MCLDTRIEAKAAGLAARNAALRDSDSSTGAAERHTVRGGRRQKQQARQPVEQHMERQRLGDNGCRKTHSEDSRQVASGHKREGMPMRALIHSHTHAHRKLLFPSFVSLDFQNTSTYRGGLSDIGSNFHMQREYVHTLARSGGRHSLCFLSLGSPDNSAYRGILVE